MAAFGAGLLDDPLAASDWDTDGFFAGADRAGASTNAPQAEHLQSAFDVNAMGMAAAAPASALAGAWGIAPPADASFGALEAPPPVSAAPQQGWPQYGLGDNVNLPMPADASAFMGEAGLFHQLSGDMLDHTGVPSEVTLGHDGELHVSKELVCFHMPPFKNGCAAQGKQIKNLGGDSAQGAVVKRNAYYCRNCHSKWSMIHPAQLQPGQDPMVNTDCKKAVSDDDPKRAGGYRHSIRTGGCGKLLKKKYADQVGEEPCTCDKSKTA
eukprot:131813-Prymnesium_polylepis.1